MSRKLLAAILVIVVFMGGYSALSKKYNPLPVTEVSAATKFKPGMYKVLAPFTVSRSVKSNNTLVNPTVYRTFEYGEVIRIDSKGYCENYYVGNQSSCYLKYLG